MNQNEMRKRCCCKHWVFSVWHVPKFHKRSWTCWIKVFDGLVSLCLKRLIEVQGIHFYEIYSFCTIFNELFIDDFPLTGYKGSIYKFEQKRDEWSKLFQTIVYCFFIDGQWPWSSPDKMDIKLSHSELYPIQWIKMGTLSTNIDRQSYNL